MWLLSLRMNIYEALKSMRKMSDNNIPFSFTFISCKIKSCASDGEKRVGKALLRTGYSSDKSSKHNSLVAYYDLDKDTNGFFYLPLLTELNNVSLK